MTTVDPGPLDLDESGFAAIGKHWGVVLTLGILSLLVGIIAIAWPGKTVVVVAVLVAIWLIVSGVFQIIRGFSRGLSGGMRALLFISGILSLILGVIAFGSMFQAVEILAIIVGIGFLFRGFGLLFSAGEDGGSRGWSIFGGIVMIIGGFVVLVYPYASVATLAWVMGIWLVIGGIFEIIASFKLRSLAKAA
jgi:uncharacterized membrane protein HdeD (DUF308 family)